MYLAHAAFAATITERRGNVESYTTIKGSWAHSLRLDPAKYPASTNQTLEEWLNAVVAAVGDDLKRPCPLDCCCHAYLPFAMSSLVFSSWRIAAK